MSIEDIALVLCYTFEWDKERFGDIESPYKKLNNSLSIDRNNKSLKKTCALLFLLLKTVRRLPRFVPENRTLYRGIKFLVQTEPDPKFPKRKPYAAGNEKTWWTFTSTSMSLEATRNFIGKNESTLFLLSGETWGYDISMFSDFPDENEILLEPERKLSIMSVSRNDNIITVNAKFVDTPVVLKDIIEVGKTIKIKERKSKRKIIPNNLRSKVVTNGIVELMWDVMDVEGRVISYQVFSRKTSNGLFNRNPVRILKTTETKCTIIMLDIEYELFVRCVFDDGMGEWSRKIVIKADVSTPKNIKLNSNTWDSIALSWSIVEDKPKEPINYEIDMKRENERDFTKIYSGTKMSYTKRGLLSDTVYDLRVRTVRGNLASEWSAIAKGRTQEKLFETSRWKECPGTVDESRKYFVDENNLRIATNMSDGKYCTIIGNTSLPLNKVTSWNIKILKSKKNDGSGIFIGVSSFEINQNENDNYKKCGWYFYCYDSTLWSGPPHNYNKKEYGPRKEKYGQYVHTGDSVGVAMDTIKGELSFIVNDVNYGVAFEGIPLDKPLVPCVLLKEEGDSVRLDLSEVKENEVDNSILVPSNISTKSMTWDSITLTWDLAEGASFYQVEVDESKSWETSTTNKFVKRGLFEETKHNFRVRTVKENSVSGWSGVVEGKTQMKSFETSFWKECPDYVEEKRKYSVDENNPRIVKKNDDDGWCTIIGNTHLLLIKVTSWNIKILKSKKNDASDIFIGVAPSGIDQNVYYNYKEFGWYFCCYDSTLWSGLPHNYNKKEYGPRKEKYGQYVHTGDIVSAVVDTAKGELSFVLNGVNYGVTYEKIPLDKPLVPCVLLLHKNDSTELII